MEFSITLEGGKKAYLASDFHLGTPNDEASLERELKIISWLDQIKGDAQVLFLLGDIFDFWFEYRKVIPKGFIRFQGKIAELKDQGIEIHFFSGNHDMWMFDYFPSQLGIPVHHEPQEFVINGKTYFLGHGDGLGPGDKNYKRLKKIFRNRYCQKAFAFLHPSIGISIAQRWSRNSRITSSEHEETFHGENEHLLIYCRRKQQEKQHDFYIFGHRHLAMDLKVDDHSKYINLGEWVKSPHYAVISDQDVTLLKYEN